MRDHSSGELAEWMRLARSAREAFPVPQCEDPVLLAFAAAPVGLAIILLNGCFHLANPVVCKILGRTPAELRSLSVMDLLHPDHRMPIFEMAESILDDDIDTYRQERAFLKPDGTVVWVDATGVVLRDASGAPQFILAIGHDISERHRRENTDHPVTAQHATFPLPSPAPLRAAQESRAQREARLLLASQELDEMCRSLAHDVRTPVRIMSGFADILLEEKIEGLCAEHLQVLGVIREQSQRLGRQLDGLLELSRLTRSNLNRQAIDIGEHAQDIFRELTCLDRGHEIELVVEAGLHANGDPLLVDQLLRHLIDNARKFTRNVPAARIEIGCTHASATPVYFVRDNGVGFDMAYASKLFATFETLHTGSDLAGDGLGLASVRRIVHRHGGEVWAESSSGCGATFHFTLES